MAFTTSSWTPEAFSEIRTLCFCETQPKMVVLPHCCTVMNERVHRPAEICHCKLMLRHPANRSVAGPREALQRKNARYL